MGAKYAQHFLINRHASERIVELAKISPDDVVLEIGPGKGALTAFLGKAKAVAVVEVDAEMVTLLKSRFGGIPQIHIFHSDILKFDLQQLEEFRDHGKQFKVIGNLPYNLTSPILRKLSDWSGWSEAFIMVQKEVADRMCAKHGTPDYGALTVGMSLTCGCELVFELSETSFNPPPKVKSAVVKLTRREKPLTTDINGTQRVIQAAFQQRRKTILNSLSHGLELTKTEVERILKLSDIEPSLRPEQIPVEKFVALSETLR